MSDEIYEHIYYDNYKPFSFAGIDKMATKQLLSMVYPKHTL